MRKWIAWTDSAGTVSIMNHMGRRTRSVGFAKGDTTRTLPTRRPAAAPKASDELMAAREYGLTKPSNSGLSPKEYLATLTAEERSKVAGTRRRAQ